MPKEMNDDFFDQEPKPKPPPLALVKPDPDLSRAADPITGTLAPTAPVEAEVAVLGAAMLCEPKVTASILSQVEPGHMTHPVRCTILAAMQRVHERGDPVDAVTLATELRGEKVPDLLGTVERLMLAVPTTSNHEAYTEAVISGWEKREEGRLRDQIHLAAIPLQPQKIEDLERHQALMRARQAARVKSPSFAETLVECLDHMEHGTKTAPKVSTTIWALNDIAGGFPVEGLTVVAARPGMGKSTFATCLIPHVIEQRDNRPVIFFSMEMPRVELAFCLLSAVSNLPRMRLSRSDGKPADLNDADWGRMGLATGTLGRLALVVEDQPTQTPAFMRATIDRELAERQVDAPAVIFVDYLQKVDAVDAKLGKGASREQAVSWVAEQLRVMARDYKCPVVALAQLNRNLETRRDRRPTLSDLRESGSIEQDAHLVLGLYRPTYYDEDAKDEVDEIIVLKNRAGPLGTARCRYDGRVARWEEIETGEQV